MSLYDYKTAVGLEETSPSFYALLMATIRKAGDVELAKIESVFPGVVAEVRARYNAPGGMLEGD
jgi:hypothetical protein